jgi:hypothetical protein
MSDAKWTDEHTKMLIDALDDSIPSNSKLATAIGGGITRNAVIGQRCRYGYHQGHKIVINLAKRFPDATAREIAEATARDRAPQILSDMGIQRELGGDIRENIVAAMRASLASEGA